MVGEVFGEDLGVLRWFKLLKLEVVGNHRARKCRWNAIRKRLWSRIDVDLGGIRDSGQTERQVEATHSWRKESSC